MPIAATIDFPESDVRAIFGAIDRGVRELGRDLGKSLSWAGAYVAKSLAAATRKAPKLRPVVENPDKRYKTDARRAPFGVMKYDKDGNQYFKPIYRTGEYGKIRFFDKRSMSWFARRINGQGRWERLKSGADIANPEIIAPGIMTDRRRRIGRSGLAKKAWAWAAAHAYSGGTASLMGVPSVAAVRVFRSQDNPGVQIDDRLRYAGLAFKDGFGAPQRAVGNAARKLAYNIDTAIKKRTGAA